ncbi:MAG: cyclic nucleotide-binding domain-containing protein [Proteobacteria bacterium]|nr:cyclic nucleotide-binding domain-containing protein [Pseudomonadota bacterium]
MLTLLEPPQAALRLHGSAGESLSGFQDYALMLSCARGEAVYHEADAAHHLYRVLSGMVRLCRHTADGHRRIAEFALPGDLFGALHGQRQDYTAEAVCNSRLVAYPRQHANGLAGHQLHMTGSAVHLLTTQQHGFAMASRSARVRMAAFLLRLAERSGAVETGHLDLAMERQDIADHLGLTLEAVYRTLHLLALARIILIGGPHRILLQNVEALCELAEGGATQ